MEERIEAIILRSLLSEEGYTRRVLPFIDESFFLDKTERNIFTKVRDFVTTYNALPSPEAVVIELDNTTGLAGDQFEQATSYLKQITATKPASQNEQWLVEQTESWCQEKAVHNAVLEVVGILGDKSGKREKGLIPKLLQDALGLSFDPHVGHDYLENAEDRYNFYHKKETRIPFHLDMFNAITKNGIPRKTLNIILAGTGVGKSLFMCDLASHYLMTGKNVLYITMEMAEERIAERIDANLLDVSLDDLIHLAKDVFDKRIDRINSKTTGKLIIKEYPTASSHVGHFRHLLNELSLKKKFIPDVIFIDYLNICASSRIRAGASGGSYELVKSIAEELRGLAVEFNVPVWSATQMNRAGFNNNDPDLTNTSESFGLPATADFMFALVIDEALAAMNQLLVKILKNRYGDLSMRNKDTGKSMSRFVVGIDRSKMKLYNLDPSAQDGLDNESPATTPRPGTPPQRPPTSSSASLDDADSTAPWEVSNTAPTRAKSATDPAFEIDFPPNAAAEEAERLRVSAAFGSVGYKAAYTASGRPRQKFSG